MAEFVYGNIERLLPELEEAERIKLLSTEECRKILKRREDLEYRLQRREKQASHFVEYIEYEKDVLALLKKRRYRLGITVKREQIDVAIVKRIHQLYRLVCRRFPWDISLWRSHIQFCRDRKEGKSASKTYDLLLRTHNKKPELWAEAAELEINLKNLTGARALILKGLRFNPGSKVLLLKLFKMELAFAKELWQDWEKRRSMLKEVDDKAPSLKHVTVVLKKALEEHPDDLGLVKQLLKFSNKYTFTGELVDILYDRVRERHLHLPQAWDLLARQHLVLCRGPHSPETVTQEKLAISKYEEAVTQLSTEAMWELYLNACLETLEWEAEPALCHQRLQRALDVFSRAAELKLLSPSGFLKWVRVLSRTGQVGEVVRVSALGTKLQPACPQLWLCRLQSLAQTLAPPADLHRVFQAARQSLPDKEAWPIWEAYLSYLASHDDAQMLEFIFQEAAGAGPEVSQRCKPVQLQWTFLQHGLKSARKLFKSLSRSRPCPPVVYRQYLTMELSQVEVKMKRIRRAYDLACHEHGANHPGLWASLLALELFHPQGDAARVGEVRFAAEQALEPSGQVEAFRQLRAELEARGRASPAACLAVWGATSD